MKSWHTVPLAALAVAAATVVPRGAQSQFTPSDPVVSEADIYDASGVRPTDASTERMRLAAAFARSSDAPCGVTSANSIGEVPDGSWFVNRIGTTRLSPADVARGPNRLQESLTGPWTVVAAKTDGVTPGLRMKDRAGRVFYVKFDPPKFPELASGAEVVATKLLWAAGYWVPENYIVRFRPAELTLAPDATFKGPDGVPRPITSRDVDRLLATAARTPDGSYRVVASLRIPGQPLGPFQYSGVRPDDPNDRVPHECRRELRGLRVFAAWLNHVDTKPGNTLDSLAPTGSIKVVRHFLLDFGSTLGSAGTQPKDWRDGFEYAADGRTAVLALATFGLHTPPWLHAEFPVLPSIGRIESRYFQPDTWKPTLANPAFQRADEDDAFWAARKVIAFSDDLIRAAVASGEYLGSGSGAVPRGRPHRSSRCHSAHVDRRRQPDRESAHCAGRPSDVRQRRRRGARGVRYGRVSNPLGAVRQHHSDDLAARPLRVRARAARPRAIRACVCGVRGRRDCRTSPQAPRVGAARARVPAPELRRGLVGRRLRAARQARVTAVGAFVLGPSVVAVNSGHLPSLEGGCDAPPRAPEPCSRRAALDRHAGRDIPGCDPAGARDAVEPVDEQPGVGVPGAPRPDPSAAARRRHMARSRCRPVASLARSVAGSQTGRSTRRPRGRRHGRLHPGRGPERHGGALGRWPP